MLNIPTAQQTELSDIADAIAATHFGQYMPQEYKDFYSLWGFFNGIYNALYTDREEWKRISRFAIDTNFSPIWSSLSQLSCVQQLAKQPCVGNGRNGNEPTAHTRIAFQTLRTEFQIEVSQVCQSNKCQSRNQICNGYQWPQSPTNSSVENAKFKPLGATLLIVYQIRNNLFHGTKREFSGHEYERNKLLVSNSSKIIRALLEKIQPIISV